MVIGDKFPAGTKVFQLPLSWFRKVTAWINNFCGGVYVTVSRPSEPSAAAPVRIDLDIDAVEAELKGRGLGAAATAGDGIAVSGRKVSAKAKPGGGVAVDSDGIAVDPDALGFGTGAGDNPSDLSAATAATDTMDTTVSVPFSLDRGAWAADSGAPLALQVVSRFYNPNEHGGNAVARYLVCRTLLVSPNGRVAAVSAENAVYKLRTT